LSTTQNCFNVVISPFHHCIFWVRWQILQWRTFQDPTICCQIVSRFPEFDIVRGAWWQTLSIAVTPIFEPAFQTAQNLAKLVLCWMCTSCVLAGDLCRCVKTKINMPNEVNSLLAAPTLCWLLHCNLPQQSDRPLIKQMVHEIYEIGS